MSIIARRAAGSEDMIRSCRPGKRNGMVHVRCGVFEESGVGGLRRAPNGHGCEPHAPSGGGRTPTTRGMQMSVFAPTLLLLGKGPVSGLSAPK